MGAAVDQFEHELVVADAVVLVSPQARAGVHDEGDQRPSRRVEHFLGGKLGAVGLVDGGQELDEVRVAEQGRASVVVVNDAGGAAGGGVGGALEHAVGGPLFLAGVVVEPEPAARGVGDVGENVVGRDGDLAVLHVLGVDELDLVEEPLFLEEHGTAQAVEVAASQQSHGDVLSCRARRAGRAAAARESSEVSSAFEARQLRSAAHRSVGV